MERNVYIENKNDIIDFYEQKGISPVKQDISNFSLHLERRRKLYRQCGIPVAFFKNAKVLEVGPGSGYNTLAFFEWGADVELVEPNAKGVQEIVELFKERNIHESRYVIHKSRIEDFNPDRKYDIVIAEGFMDAIDNQKEVIDKLKSLVNWGGIIVITCADNVCFFIEAVKRFVSVVLTRNISNYEDKVQFLVNYFEPQLAALRGMSRPVRDWVEDQMLCPSFINGNSLSLSEAMDYFEGFFVIGSSQKMFTDYSWYKDVWFDGKSDMQKQFSGKRLSLIMAGMDEFILPAEEVDWFVHRFTKVRNFTSQYEKNQDNEVILELKVLLNEISEKIEVFPKEFIEVFYDIEGIVNDIASDIANIDVGKYQYLFRAFGRTQQYIAFEKQ